MAQAVTRAIERAGHLVVEAGTGVGKSFAYLVPAIQAAVELKKKVVVSTHTIALQEQLLNKDIPFLRSVMKDEFTAVLVKGRSNYISLRRLNGAVERQDADLSSGPKNTTSSPPSACGRTQTSRWESFGSELSAVALSLGGCAERGWQLFGPQVSVVQRLPFL